MADYGTEAAEAPLSVDDLRDLWTSLRAAAGGRNAEYARARRLYRGQHWDANENPAPKNRYSITVNYLKPFVDKDVQILMGTLPGIQVLPPTADAAGRGMAERLEGLIYGNWKLNDAHRVLLNTAFDAVCLRRGLIYYWWDADTSHPRFKSCTPDNFYPVYDGDEIVEAIYVSRRLTRALKKAYPGQADQIYSDEGTDYVFDSPTTYSRVEGGITDAMGDGGGADGRRAPMLGYTTVVDYYDNQGHWMRLMGDAVHTQTLGYPDPAVPFIEVANGVQGEEHEPMNVIDQIAELNMYFNQVLSQRADVIKKWANPPIIDAGSGVAAAVVKQTLSGDGGVLPINPKGDIRLLTWTGTMPEITEQLEAVKEAMYDLSGKPRSAFGQTITNQSGVMTNMALTPTLQSNELRETLWGAALVRLNREILQMYEEFSKGREIHFRGTRVGKTPKNQVPFEVKITGKEIAGWYENRMKWPSAIRVDDPAYVQMLLSQLTAKPQAISIYDFLEERGIEDVEAWIDRIKAEHEDPRIHPEIMESAINSVTQLAGAIMPPEMSGGPPLLEQGAGSADYNQGMIDGAQPLPAAA